MPGPDGAAPAGASPSAPLAADEALRLLGTAEPGRIVFTRHALPAVRPVNHVLDAGDIIRVQDGSTLAALLAPEQGGGAVVAHEADDVDTGGHLGWSVVATGYATVGHRP
ncbi:pyridoxamine 5'-phosphate oxidase family protein [Streptomyces subrutilus]|uniref:pyridoxamine 5'-phosphate oxidase family protein n=1 Tax=Streptomyces subrutilus TaxID=36818 RepID=UPI0033EDA0A3